MTHRELRLDFSLCDASFGEPARDEAALRQPCTLGIGDLWAYLIMRSRAQRWRRDIVQRVAAPAVPNDRSSRSRLHAGAAVFVELK